AIVFNLSEPQRPLSIAGIRDQRAKQLLPMRGDTGRPPLVDKRQIALSVLIVGAANHPPVISQPLHQIWTVKSLAGGFPSRWIGAPETIDDLLGGMQRQLIGCKLAGEYRGIHIIEKDEVEMDDVANDWRSTCAEQKTHLGDVGAAIDPERYRAMTE